jgi:hypothetical protein
MSLNFDLAKAVKLDPAVFLAAENKFLISKVE